MFAYLLDGLRFVCLEGSWSLRPHEAKTLDAAIGWLPPENAERARRQLSQRYFIERQSEGRIPCFRYYRAHENALLDDPFRRGTHYVNVRLETASRQFTAKCVLHEGIVFGLEFPKPERFFKGHTVDVVSVSCDTTGFSYTEVLNRAEHGSGAND